MKCWVNGFVTISSLHHFTQRFFFLVSTILIGANTYSIMFRKMTNRVRSVLSFRVFVVVFLLTKSSNPQKMIVLLLPFCVMFKKWQTVLFCLFLFIIFSSFYQILKFQISPQKMLITFGAQHVKRTHTHIRIGAVHNFRIYIVSMLYMYLYIKQQWYVTCK